MTEDELQKEYPDLYTKWFNYGYEAGKRISFKGFLKEEAQKIQELNKLRNTVDIDKMYEQIRHWRECHRDVVRQFEEYRKKYKPTRRRGKHSFQYKRRRSYEGNWCIYCGATATTMDHMTPISRGGTSKAENMIPACIPCNSEKGNMTYDEYMTWLKFHKPY